MENIFSLWLIPKGNIFKKYSRIIRDLSKQYSSPYFEPHITLIGGILANEKEAIKVSLE